MAENPTNPEENESQDEQPEQPPDRTLDTIVGPLVKAHVQPVLDDFASNVLGPIVQEIKTLREGLPDLETLAKHSADIVIRSINASQVVSPTEPTQLTEAQAKMNAATMQQPAGTPISASGIIEIVSDIFEKIIEFKRINDTSNPFAFARQLKQSDPDLAHYLGTTLAPSGDPLQERLPGLIAEASAKTANAMRSQGFGGKDDQTVPLESPTMSSTPEKPTAAVAVDPPVATVQQREPNGLTQLAQEI